MIARIIAKLAEWHKRAVSCEHVEGGICARCQYDRLSEPLGFDPPAYQHDADGSDEREVLA